MPHIITKISQTEQLYPNTGIPGCRIKEISLETAMGRLIFLVIWANSNGNNMRINTSVHIMPRSENQNSRITDWFIKIRVKTIINKLLVTIAINKLAKLKFNICYIIL